MVSPGRGTLRPGTAHVERLRDPWHAMPVPAPARRETRPDGSDDLAAARENRRVVIAPAS